MALLMHTQRHDITNACAAICTAHGTVRPSICRVWSGGGRGGGGGGGGFYSLHVVRSGVCKVAAMKVPPKIGLIKTVRVVTYRKSVKIPQNLGILKSSWGRDECHLFSFMSFSRAMSRAICSGSASSCSSFLQV